MKELNVDKLQESMFNSIEPFVTLQKVQEIASQEITSQTKESYGLLAQAHQLVVGVLGAVLLRINGKYTNITSTGEQRNALFAA